MRENETNITEIQPDKTSFIPASFVQPSWPVVRGLEVLTFNVGE